MGSRESGKPVFLGRVETPSGTLLILDPGLGSFWQHDHDPRSPINEDPDEVDLQIVGPDALAMGKAFDQQFDSRFLFDVENVDSARMQFAEFVNTKNKLATLDVLPERISHLERARLALEIGNGAGVVQFNHRWAVAVDGLPTDHASSIFATPMPEGEFSGRWRCIDIVVDPEARVKKSLVTEGVMVDRGQLICADLNAFGEFRAGHSLDGLADFVFWGRDAASVAQTFHAAEFDHCSFDHLSFGWKDLPLENARCLARDVQNYVNENGLKVGLDFRPHSNLEKLNSQIRNSDVGAGDVLLNNTNACGFATRWGDGLFSLIRGFDKTGRLVRVRVDVGSEITQDVMRRLIIRTQSAIVTKKISIDGQAIRFAERLEPSIRRGKPNPDDSGWAFSAGGESDAYMQNSSNLQIVSIESLLELDPALEAILHERPGSVFRRAPSGYVPDR
ncbi:MAG: DUF2185 domain-containing protein [Candidatus Obscuribacterales bacterium]|nr:DUF2185 domain-containing protein [Candidatus Obscuribacterales bacterium]